MQGFNRVNITEFRKLQQHQIQQAGHIAHLTAYAYHLERDIEEMSQATINLTKEVHKKFDEMNQLEQRTAEGFPLEYWQEHERDTRERIDALAPKPQKLEEKQQAKLLAINQYCNTN